MAEMVTKSPLFKGQGPFDQLHKTLAVLGTPSASFLCKLTSEYAVKFIKDIPHREPVELRTLVKPPPRHDVTEGIVACGICDEGLDLLRRMVDMDPTTRITVEEALRHTYLAQVSDVTDEPNSTLFTGACHNDAEEDVTVWKKLIQNEMDTFKPHDLL